MRLLLELNDKTIVEVIPDVDDPDWDIFGQKDVDVMLAEEVWSKVRPARGLPWPPAADEYPENY